VKRIFRTWQAGDASSIVGVGSVGKSNLLRHLADETTVRTQLGDDAQHTRIIIVDANLLGPLPPPNQPDSEQYRCWAGFELIMHRMFISLYPFSQLSSDDARRFYEAYQGLQDGSNPLFAYMGVRYFELGLELFLRSGLKLVFLFDEFEELLRQMPPKFFQMLRGLRDQRKGQVVYTTFSRSSIPTLVERMALDVLALEPFVELFSDHVVYVGPYNEADGKAMLLSLAQKLGVSYSDLINGLVLTATGRFAGLLRAAYAALPDAQTVDWEKQTAETLGAWLISQESVRAECNSIWMGLNPSEQLVLKAATKVQTYSINKDTENAVSMLVQKKLLRVSRQPEHTLTVEPPVFRSFMLTNPDGPA
jgi:hypothetical protein